MIERKPHHKKLTHSPSKRTGKRMSAGGKSTRSVQNREWDAELKAWFGTLGIDSCEIRFAGCMGRFGLALCHSKKRRYVLTKADYFEVCAGCVKCHEQMDNNMSHEAMADKVREIIEKRGTDGNHAN